jgi:hypothetical protein
MSLNVSEPEEAVVLSQDEKENNDPDLQNEEYDYDEAELELGNNFHKVTLELPRDILTAYFLIRLSDWPQYSWSGKLILWVTLLTPFVVQYLVLISLLSDMNILDSTSTLEFTASSAVYNLSALAVLFIYMIRDVNGLIKGLWRYLNYIEKKAGADYNPLHRLHFADLSTQVMQLTHTGSNSLSAAGTGTGAVNDNGNGNGHGHSHTTVGGASAMTNLQFMEFRVWFIAVLFLYLGFAVYSIMQIGTVEGITDKLDVAIGIFFVLEVDDWVYELFIAQNNVMTDEAFDVDIYELIHDGEEDDSEEEEDDEQLRNDKHCRKIAKDQKRMLRSLLLVFGSVLLVWAISVIPFYYARTKTTEIFFQTKKGKHNEL